MFDFDIDLVEPTLSLNLPDTQVYAEFTADLNSLWSVTGIDTLLFYEAVSTPQIRTNQKIKRTINTTIGTTKDIGMIYDNLTTAGGSVIHSFWNLGMSAISLMSKVIRFILVNLSKIPKGITRLINWIGKLPVNVFHKVRGDIALYITVNDINALYSQNLMMKLRSFIAAANQLSQGPAWNVLTGPKIVQALKGKFFNKNDLAICHNISVLYKQIGGLRFERTNVDMKDTNNISRYFGADAFIQFNDINGKKFEGNYLEALNKLIEDLQTQQSNISALNDNLCTKFNSNQTSANFAKLQPSDQQQMMNAIQQVGRMVSVIGRIVQYVIEDVKTIERTATSVAKKYNTSATITQFPNASQLEPVNS